MGDFEKYFGGGRPKSSTYQSVVSNSDIQDYLKRYEADSDAYEVDGTPLWKKAVAAPLKALNFGGALGYATVRELAEFVPGIEDDDRGWGATFNAAFHEGEGFTDFLYDQWNIDGTDNWFARAGLSTLGFAADVIADPTTYLTFGATTVGKQAVGVVAKAAGIEFTKELSKDVMATAARKRIGRELLIDGVDEMSDKELFDRVNAQLVETAAQAGKEAGDEFTKELKFETAGDMFRTYAEREVESVIGTARMVGGGRQVAQAMDEAVRGWGGTTEMVQKGFGRFNNELDRQLLGGVRFAGKKVPGSIGSGTRALNTNAATLNTMSNGAALFRLKLRAKAAPTMAKFRGSWGENYTKVIEGLRRETLEETKSATRRNLGKNLADQGQVDWVRQMRVLDIAAGDRASFIKTTANILQEPMEQLHFARVEASRAGILDETVQIALESANRHGSRKAARKALQETLDEAGIVLTPEQLGKLDEVVTTYQGYKARLKPVLEEAGFKETDIKLGFENRVLTADAIDWKRGQGDNFKQSSALSSREAFRSEAAESAELSDIIETVDEEFIEALSGNQGWMSVAEANARMRETYGIEFDFFEADPQLALDAVFTRLISTVGHRKTFERLIKEGMLTASPEASRRLTDAQKRVLITSLEDLALATDSLPPRELLDVLLVSIGTGEQNAEIYRLMREAKEKGTLTPRAEAGIRRQVLLTENFEIGFEADVDRIASLLGANPGASVDEVYEAVKETVGELTADNDAKVRELATLLGGRGRLDDDLAYTNPYFKDAPQFFERDEYVEALAKTGDERIAAAHNLMGQVVKGTVELLDEATEDLATSRIGRQMLEEGLEFDPTDLSSVGEFLSRRLVNASEVAERAEIIERIKNARTVDELSEVKEIVQASLTRANIPRQEFLMEAAAARGDMLGAGVRSVRIEDMQKQVEGVSDAFDSLATGASNQDMRRGRRDVRLGIEEDPAADVSNVMVDILNDISEIEEIYRNRDKLRGLQDQRLKPIQFTAQEGVALPGFLRGQERAIWFTGEALVDGIKNLYKAGNDPTGSALSDYSDALLTLFKTYATVGQIGIGFHVRNAIGAVSNNIAAGVRKEQAVQGQKLGRVATRAIDKLQEETTERVVNGKKGVFTVGEFKKALRTSVNAEYTADEIAEFRRLYGMDPGKAAVDAWDFNVFQSRTADALEDRANREMAFNPDSSVDREKIVVREYERQYLMNPTDDNLELWRFKSQQDENGKYINITHSELTKQRARYSKLVNNKVIDLSSRVGQHVEHAVRMGAYLQGVRNFGGSEGGAMLARSVHFDYQDLSDVEKRVMKRILPFYVWSRNNLPLQARFFVNRPAGFANLLELQQAMMQAMATPGIDQEAVPEWAKPKLGFFGGFSTEGGQLLIRMESPKLDLYNWIAGDNPLDAAKDYVEGANPLIKLVGDTSATLGGPALGLSYAKPVSEGGDGSQVLRSVANLVGLKTAGQRVIGATELLGSDSALAAMNGGEIPAWARFLGIEEDDGQDAARLLGAFTGAPISFQRYEGLNYNLYQLDAERRELVREKLAEERGVDPETIDANAIRLDAYRTGRYRDAPTADGFERPEEMTDKEWKAEQRRIERLRRYGFID